MSKDFNVEWLSYEQIRTKASVFLKTFNSQNKYPLPIEKIIELSLGLQIVTIPNLYRVFDVDGFLLSDLKEIRIDEYLYDKRPPRYYFTLAHEIGHYFLHAYLYKKNKIDCYYGWVKFRSTLPEGELACFERQAKKFAALILVPTKYLEQSCKANLKAINAVGISSDYFKIERLLDMVAKDFHVATLTIKKRLERETILSTRLQTELVSKFS